MGILQLAATSSSGSQVWHRAITLPAHCAGLLETCKCRKKVHKWAPCFLPPSVYLGVAKCLRIRTVCTPNFKEKESWGAWYQRTAQLSQIVVRWLCLCPQENLQTKANYPYLHLTWTACLCICIPTRHCGHPSPVLNYTFCIVSNRGLVTRSCQLPSRWDSR